ncbi:MAG: hypothetical protein ACP5O3_00295 [Candidatus Micrarchaeia archaeon]
MKREEEIEGGQESEEAVINSELRFITLELMKIAALRGCSFSEVAKEFFANASRLHSALRGNNGKGGARNNRIR